MPLECSSATPPEITPAPICSKVQLVQLTAPPPPDPPDPMAHTDPLESDTRDVGEDPELGRDRASRPKMVEPLRHGTPAFVRMAGWWRALTALQRLVAATLLVLALEALRRGAMCVVLGIPRGVTGGWTAKTTLDLVYNGYLNQLKSDPMFTKMVTSMWLYGLSDLIVQLMSRKSAAASPPQRLDFDRLLRFTWFGTFLVTPLLSAWHPILDNRLRPDSSLHAAVTTAVVNQVVITPLITFTYFVYEAIATGAPAASAKQEINQRGPRIVLYAWAFWLPCDTFNFAFVPLLHRVLYICTVGLAWNIIFSCAVSGGHHAGDRKLSPSESRAQLKD